MFAIPATMNNMTSFHIDIAQNSNFPFIDSTNYTCGKLH